MGYSTFLNIASWSLIGLAYPLYNVFLPDYLRSRGASTGDGSVNTTYRNYAIVNVCSILGPMIAGALVEVRFLGRRYTMVIGALLTMGFLFAYTTVRTAAQNLIFSCIISVCLEHLLQCSVCLHTRSASIGSSRNRQCHHRGVQQSDGHRRCSDRHLH